MSGVKGHHWVLCRFLIVHFTRQGDPNPVFPAGRTHYLREGYKILLCPARYANVNSYTNLKSEVLSYKWQNALKIWKVFVGLNCFISNISIHVLCSFCYFVLWPTNAQIFHKLSHCYITWYFSDRASWIDYILITNLTHWLLFIHKYYSPLHVSSLKCSSSGGYSCIHAAYGTVTLYEISWWPVSTQLEVTDRPTGPLIESDSTICCMCTTVSSWRWAHEARNM